MKLNKRITKLVEDLYLPYRPKRRTKGKIAIEAGIDMFDCVMPTRNARNGSLFTSNGKVVIKQARYRDDPEPLDPNCECQVCQKYTRAYLRHLFMSKEVLSMRLNTYHNLFFYLSLVKKARKAIQQQNYSEFKIEFLKQYHQGV